MGDQRRQRLSDLGVEPLADALLELAIHDDAVDDLVERMIATPGENTQRFKAKLSGLRRSRRGFSWSESADLAHELRALLRDLEAGVDDPCTGSEMVVAFYETDEETLGRCDDSNGCVGDVYRYYARELFVEYAGRCDEKDRLSDLVFELNRDDAYGVRDTLIDCATDYLPEPNIRAMIIRLREAADKESDEYEERHWLHLIESLARQIGDAKLFEETRIASWGEPSTAACVDIARVYLQSGDVRTSLSWLQRIPARERFMVHQRDQLLLDIYGRLGETEKQADVAWRVFRRHRSESSLQELLAVIGSEHHETVIVGEVAKILGAKSLSLSDAVFLVGLGRMDEAQDYLLDRADQLDGGQYGILLPLAEAMESEQRPLAASVLYRALLDSILWRGQTRTYSHGVRYLKKLDRLAGSITDWLGLDDHTTYMQGVRQAHGRKYSFWSRYGD